MYEIFLYLMFIKLLIFGKLRIIINEDMAKEDIASVVNDVNEKYDKENKSFTNDIIYAISTE